MEKNISIIITQLQIKRNTIKIKSHLLQKGSTISLPVIFPLFHLFMLVERYLEQQKNDSN